MALAESALQAKNYQDAVSYYNKILEEDSTYSATWFSKGVVSLEHCKKAILDCSSEAIIYFDNAIKYSGSQKNTQKSVSDFIFNFIDDGRHMLDTLLLLNMIKYDPSNNKKIQLAVQEHKKFGDGDSYHVSGYSWQSLFEQQSNDFQKIFNIIKSNNQDYVTPMVTTRLSVYSNKLQTFLVVLVYLSAVIILLSVIIALFK